MGQLEIVEMRLSEIQASEGGAQVVLLTEVEGDREFPIFIGPVEMSALDMALHGVVAARPLTHDLVLNAIEAMGGELRRVVVDDLREETFFGKLDVRVGEGRVLVDSRPSDALVLAVRRSVPIFVAEHVLQRAGHRAQSED